MFCDFAPELFDLARDFFSARSARRVLAIASVSSLIRAVRVSAPSIEVSISDSKALIGFLSESTSCVSACKFLVVANQGQTHPLVADSDFGLGELALRPFFAPGGNFLVLFGEAIELGLILGVSSRI